MLYLGKIIGLEFEPDCDFHKEIILTMKGSINALNRGLATSYELLRDLIKIKNYIGLFKLGGEDLKIGVNYFSRLPLILIKQILSYFDEKIKLVLNSGEIRTALAL